MDRQIVYPGAIPLETDLLNTNKNAMLALAKLSAAMLGTNTVVNGLAVTAQSPAAMAVNVAPGEIYMNTNVDANAYSSLAADTSHQIMKQGISLDSVAISLAAPTTVGYSVNYLIQATYQDVDANSVTLPYYNSSNPSQAWSGPNNTGTANYTTRKGAVIVTSKAGVAATTGTQTTPSPDSGYVGLYVVTVAYGASSITAGNITPYANAPFIPNNGILVGGLQNNLCNSSVAGGTSDALTGSYNPGITSLPSAGNGVLTLYLRAASANTTTTPTFTPNSGAISAKTIVKGNGLALVAGDIAGAVNWLELQYDATLDKWVLLNPAKGVASISAATESIAGIAQIATSAQALSGTDNTTIMTPAKIRDAFNISGSAPMFACRAWVNFNAVPLNGTYSQSGTTVTVTMTAHGMSVGQNVNLSITSGTGVSGSYPVATVIDANTFTYTSSTSLTTSGNVTRNIFIRASGNVSSITDNGTGNYTINFGKNMPNINYAITTAVDNQGAAGIQGAQTTGYALDNCTINVRNAQNSAQIDNTYVNVIVVG